MCTGLEIAGMLAGPLISGVGAAMQQNEAEANARRQADARNEKLRQYLGKNDQLADQSREQFNQRVQQTDAQQMAENQQQNTQSRQDALTEAIQPPSKEVGDAVAPISGSAPDVVRSTLAKKMSDAIDYGTQRAKALGALGAYGDTWLDQGFADANAGRNLGVLANLAAGNSALLPYEQDFAQQKAYKPISPIGGILQGVGSAIGSYAGNKSSPWG